MDQEYTFNGQRPHEKILAVVRTHPFVLFMPGLKTIGFWAIAVALVLLWSNQYSSLLAFVLFIIGLGFLARAYFMISQSSFIITNQRVLNVQQNGYFGRKITETELGNIQDVSSETAGALRTMLKYGNLIIRTSGTAAGNEIVVRDIANPYEVQQMIANVK